MEKSDLEAKYQKLASEYSKLRSQATVLRKAVLDEQSKILNYKDIINEQEQKIRKHDQEMESIVFRNEQLSKRILVLQQELHSGSSTPSKKNKNRNAPVESNAVNSNFNIIDEELQKRIIENAQLASLVADKDIEIDNYKEKVAWLEEKVRKISNELEETSTNLQKLKLKETNSKGNSIKECESCKDISFWKEELNRWKSECELLRSKPDTDEKLTAYYESQIAELIESRAQSKSKAISLETDNEALKTRLEHLILEQKALESILEKSNEELHTTTENYKSQLDAMTEHLASQNEKIAKQCDQIEILKHNLAAKK